MGNLPIVAGAVLCAISVLAGAFGAHGLEARLDERGLELWETAAKYLMYGGFGGILAGLAAVARPSASLGSAGLVLMAGGVVFAGTLFAMALGAPRWLGAITPLGGLGLVVGFLWLAWAAWR